jgi:hypothetical protein
MPSFFREAQLVREGPLHVQVPRERLAQAVVPAILRELLQVVVAPRAEQQVTVLTAPAAQRSVHVREGLRGRDVSLRDRREARAEPCFGTEPSSLHVASRSTTR